MNAAERRQLIRAKLGRHGAAQLVNVSHPGLFSAAHPGLPVIKRKRAYVRNPNEFSGGKPFGDDVCLLAGELRA